MFAIQLGAVLCTVLAAAAVAAVLLRTPRPRHGRRRGVHYGLPTEIRRHRRTTRDHTWAGTLSSRRVAASTLHALDALDTTGERRRYAAANRYEATGEITQSDLGPRPAELIGAAA